MAGASSGNGGNGCLKSLCTCVKKWVKGHKVLTGIAIGAVGAGLIVFLANELPSLCGSSSKSSSRSALWKGPVEFLYLDRTRLVSYLDQLEGGGIGKAIEKTKQLQEAKAGASLEGIDVGASSQEENEVEKTLTPVASSEVWTMLEKLEEEKEIHRINLRQLESDASSSSEGPEEPQPRSPRRRRAAEPIREGWLVDFPTRELLNPAYIRPYEILHHGATLTALFEGRRDAPTTDRRASVQRKKAQAFAKEVGPNPPIALSIDRRARRGEWSGAAKVLMPTQYKDLVGERAMLEKGRGRYVGGELHVIGKVIRVFRDRNCSKSKAPKTYCAREPRPVYTDLAVREAWRGPLENASHYLIDRVSHACKARWSAGQRTLGDGARIKAQHCFLAKLMRDTRLSAPGLVILPVAIYK
jgi:hypothetical protein